MNNEEENEEFNPLKAVFESIKRKKAIDDDIDAITIKHSEKAETEILVELWKELGDGTETYWEAYKGIEAFIKMQKSIKKHMMKQSVRTQAPLLKAMAKIIEHLEETFKSIRELEKRHKIGLE